MYGNKNYYFVLYHVVFLQSIFPTTYERHKLVAKDELRQNKWAVELNPRLVRLFLTNLYLDSLGRTVW